MEDIGKILNKTHALVRLGFAMVTMNCPKCGAPFEYEPGMRFKKCDYCGTMIYIDKSRVMFYYVIPFSLSKNQAIETFRRWAAGPKMEKGLENSKIKSIKPMFFPVYRFVRIVNGKEQVIIKPAKTTLLPGLTKLKVPPGDMKIFDASFNPRDAEVVKADLSMDTYLQSLPGKEKEQEIVFFPIYEIRYEFQGKEYNVVMDASSGEVFTSYYPPRSSVPYLAIAGTTFVLTAIGAAIGTMVHPTGWLVTLFGLIVGIGGGYYIAKKY